MNTNTSGWTDRTEGTALRRSDIVPENFHAETVKADPAAAAWGDPGYVDPDLSHGSLELGTRYWQGFAKKATRPANGERAMSPEWVAKVTPRHASGGTSFEEADPLREHVVREKEVNKRSWILPG